MLDTRETIMAIARATAQAHGYTGLSFRELAREVGVKSASIHYHFPTKGDLGAALARRYAEDAAATLEQLWAETPDPATCLQQYAAVFRRALENDNRMCLCGFMAAEYDDLPEAVRVEVQRFADINIAWLARVLAAADTAGDAAAAERRARAIFAAIGGAQLIARSRGDIAVYDEIIDSYRAAGPDPVLEHRAKKWEPVFRKKRCDNKYLEQAKRVGFNAACSRRPGSIRRLAVGHEVAQRDEAALEPRSLVEQPDRIEAAQLIALGLAHQDRVVVERLCPDARAVDVDLAADAVEDRGTVDDLAGADADLADAADRFLGDAPGQRLGQRRLAARRVALGRKRRHRRTDQGRAEQEGGKDAHGDLPFSR